MTGDKTMNLVNEFSESVQIEDQFEYSQDNIDNFTDSCVLIKVECLDIN